MYHRDIFEQLNKFEQDNPNVVEASNIFRESYTKYLEALLAMQEPLGKEFEKVLQDHFYDLIVRT